MRRTFLAPAAAAATLMLAIPASAAEPTPGAPGVGDPYYPDYGNGGYDVAHYDLRLRYQPRNDRLKGTATLLVKATQDLSRFNLDFALDVREVRVNGRVADVAATGAHELEVTPDRPLTNGQRATVVVRYAGTPSEVEVNGFTSWHRTPDGGVAANEPEAAWWWFPSNDHPTDKATYDVSVAVPDGTQAVSNGVLASQRSEAGWTRWNWRSTEPQATYLATLAVGKFDLTTDTTAGGLPVLNAYSRELGPHEGAARASIERTGEVTEWLEGYFGAYPFHAIGGYVPDTDTGYALETQTRPFYSPRKFQHGSNVSVVVHEMAHQWYGNSVSLERWSDIWLNEGFASYAEWMWSEHAGEGTVEELAAYAYDSVPADDDFWTVKPGDPGPENQFHGAVYNRGAMALQALRTEIGDRDFFAVLKGWQRKHAGGDASIDEFVAYTERKSGEQLDALFGTWLFQPSKPAVGPNGGAGGADRSAASAGVPDQPESWKKIQAAHEGGHGHR
ncbi:M1 family metallopeptidase [Streptomyces sp. DSM 42041]|uniref:Aminopeptidase N n=1 Tax=Streptomyces hazeniae TaxID=3075538 RepID=A0ABU2NTS7_9ACTN|nr:M1 family metallopeptidase [Streptomyces sp. DSM 42041]MDT0380016.1 M1 family metallopeptidase [Streptomyces sp. DSM 42041]